ncbi:helix-turn-helix domain-containing protein [Chitinophaga sp. S165]|uniref:helix-turn-helix domain-containing protein n=1 Tax=Chitinophaga sp. S165 TaxID=2135462 RepID=UPI000D71CCF6|nr:helix-turn-helix domain-containing protein [Chitinophaga sp. S165]PWV54346.1 AraC-like DNA-binding protein [Chitinophaga sp. S165]
MIFHKHIPCLPLSDYIQHIVYVSGSTPDIPYIKELPDKGINLVIELQEKTINTAFLDTDLKEKVTMKNAWISGTQRQAILYQNQTVSSILSIRFTTGGFYALTKIPITAIHQVCVEAELLLGNSFKHLYEKLINTNDVGQLFVHIESYFLQCIRDQRFEDSLTRFVDKNIGKPIDWLIKKSGYSQRHVIQVVKQHTGFSPKYLQRLHRFQNVIRDIQALKGKTDWMAIVNDYDYFDQAHFIKEFSQFTGIKPTEYLLSQMEVEDNQLVADMILRPPSE